MTVANIYLITSGKGGTGKSSLTALLGRALADRGRSALLIELDSGLRGLDMMLGVSDQVVFDLGDLLTGRCRPTEAITVIPTPEGNLHYIAAAVDPDLRPSAEELSRLLSGFGSYFDYILLDSPAGMGEVPEAAAPLCTAALLVTQAQPVCVRDAAALMARLRRQGLKSQRLIINAFMPRQLRQGFLDLDEVIDLVGAQLIGVVPQDPALAEAMATGQPLGKKAAAYPAITAIAARLEGEYVPLKAVK